MTTHRINYSGMWLTACLAWLSACTPASSVLPEGQVTPSASTGAVCDHEFTQQQLATQLQFVERESNTIVSGNTPAELLESLMSSSPYRGLGNTTWSINWSFDSRRGVSGCAITNVQVDVDVDYHLPLWPGQLSATDRALTDQWNEYSDTLRAHHCKHGKTGIDAAMEVKANLIDLAPQASCSALKDDADALARSIIDQYRQIESNFTAPAVTDYLR